MEVMSLGCDGLRRGESRHGRAGAGARINRAGIAWFPKRVRLVRLVRNRLVREAGSGSWFGKRPLAYFRQDGQPAMISIAHSTVN
jgi:hypothetical protein